MKKIILALFTVILFASFTSRKDMSIVINKTDRDLFPSPSIMEGNSNDFMNSLSGDLREYNESKGLKKPRTML